jgi:hypothetical protein
MIETECNFAVKWNSSIEVWQNKIRHLIRFLNGWACNRREYIGRKKERLLFIIDDGALRDGA